MLASLPYLPDHEVLPAQPPIMQYRFMWIRLCGTVREGSVAIAPLVSQQQRDRCYSFPFTYGQTRPVLILFRIHGTLNKSLITKAEVTAIMENASVDAPPWPPVF